ncbi:hypothetical protein BJV78DRAFT_1199667 [Lactifluus subvellereus]|nr:hypothetical protein BJV78DRAFT_1199667 [Lactifluus subvellereus]
MSSVRIAPGLARKTHCRELSHLFALTLTAPSLALTLICTHPHPHLPSPSPTFHNRHLPNRVTAHLPNHSVTTLRLVRHRPLCPTLLSIVPVAFFVTFLPHCFISRTSHVHIPCILAL